VRILYTALWYTFSTYYYYHHHHHHHGPVYYYYYYYYYTRWIVPRRGNPTPRRWRRPPRHHRDDVASSSSPAGGDECNIIIFGIRAQCTRKHNGSHVFFPSPPSSSRYLFTPQRVHSTPVHLWPPPARASVFCTCRFLWSCVQVKRAQRFIFSFEEEYRFSVAVHILYASVYNIVYLCRQFHTPPSYLGLTAAAAAGACHRVANQPLPRTGVFFRRDSFATRLAAFIFPSTSHIISSEGILYYDVFPRFRLLILVVIRIENSTKLRDHFRTFVVLRFFCKFVSSALIFVLRNE